MPASLSPVAARLVGHSGLVVGAAAAACSCTCPTPRRCTFHCICTCCLCPCARAMTLKGCGTRRKVLPKCVGNVLHLRRTYFCNLLPQHYRRCRHLTPQPLSSFEHFRLWFQRCVPCLSVCIQLAATATGMGTLPASGVPWPARRISCRAFILPTACLSSFNVATSFSMSSTRGLVRVCAKAHE